MNLIYWEVQIHCIWFSKLENKILKNNPQKKCTFNRTNVHVKAKQYSSTCHPYFLFYKPSNAKNHVFATIQLQIITKNNFPMHLYNDQITYNNKWLTFEGQLKGLYKENLQYLSILVNCQSINFKSTLNFLYTNCTLYNCTFLELPYPKEPHIVYKCKLYTL